MALLLAAVAAALALFPATAAARFEPFDAAGIVHADGKRYAAFDRAGVTRVLDTSTGAAVDVAEPGVCHVRGVGGGQVLWECPGSQGSRSLREPWLYDVRSGHVRKPPGWAALDGAYVRSGGTIDVRGIGRRWIHLRVSWYRDHRELFLNWRTGEVVVGESQGPLDPRVFYSTDARRPLVRMCRPLRHRVNRDYESFAGGFDKPLEPFVYARPYGIALPVRERAALRLQRCGSRRSRVLSRRGGASVSLGDGLVTWSQPSGRRAAIYAYHLRTRRRVRLGSVPRTSGNPYLPIVTRTATRVFASEPDTSPRRWSAPLRLSGRSR